MQAAYQSGDPYLAFAKQAGHIPPHGTKVTYAAERELFKTGILGVQYAMGERTQAQRMGRSTALARDLLRLHWAPYRSFWAWSDSAVDSGMLHGHLPTVFGWRVQIDGNANPRGLTTEKPDKLRGKLKDEWPLVRLLAVQAVGIRWLPLEAELIDLLADR